MHYIQKCSVSGVAAGQVDAVKSMINVFGDGCKARYCRAVINLQLVAFFYPGCN